MSDKLAKEKSYIALIISYIFNLLPIKKNKIFLFSYYGSQYGCSPKYISEYIAENYPDNKFDIVWAFNDVKSKKSIKNIRVVKTMSLRYFYELCTSKVIITNFRTTNSFVKRKSQYYIQTWHSSLRLKKIEKDAEQTLPKDYIEMARKDSKKCDLLLSGCKYSTEIFKRSFWYDGEIFEHGTPRNDIFFNNYYIDRDQIKKKLNINPECKVILYAPTFRKDTGLSIYNLNYSEIINKLECKFNGKWILLVKLHPHLISKSDQLIYGENILDVTSYDDIQELLSISDILISDYSSLIFDFLHTSRPCFLYVPDLEEYKNSDRGLYFELEKLPFIEAKNNEELTQKIDEFDYKKYSIDLARFSKEVGTFEEGKACENLLSRINEICFS